MQNNNLLKKAILALLLCVAMPCVNAQMAHIGDILCEGDLIVSPANYPSSGATAIGVVFYVDQTGQHGWAVALHDAGELTWGPLDNNTPLTDYENMRQAIYDIDGYENTQIIRACGTDYPAFYAVDFENGWYVPAIGQLNCLYGNLMEINIGLTKTGGDVFSSTNWTYWSSTESIWGRYAWWLQSSGHIENWDHCCNYYETKETIRKVRAVRNF